MDQPKSPQVSSVKLAIRILRHLASGNPQGVNAIARAMGASPSSCFNILKTLVSEDFLDFDPDNKTYRLGRSPALIFRPESGLDQWVDWIGDELAEIAYRYLVACGLWRVTDSRLVLIKAFHSPDTTRLHIADGQRLPLYSGAMGRAVAGRRKAPIDVIRSEIANLRWQSPPSAEAYARDAEESLRRGWAVDRGNYLKGITTLASTIGQHGKPGFCLTCTLFEGQYEPTAESAIGTKIAALAQQAEARLGQDNEAGISQTHFS